MARQQGSRFLFASTSEVYDDPLVHPQKESYYGNVNSFGPRSCYDESKRFGEALCYNYKNKYKLNIRIARIFNTYGPRMRANDGRVIPNFFMQALNGQALSIFGKGTQTRSLCYVSDLVKGLHLLMQSDHSLPTNIGSPWEQSILELADEVNKICDNKAGLRYLPLPKDDPLVRKPDISKAKELLGWEPSVKLQAGLQKTMDFFKTKI